jgi:hypothetical protein
MLQRFCHARHRTKGMGCDDEQPITRSEPNVVAFVYCAYRVADL